MPSSLSQGAHRASSRLLSRFAFGRRAQVHTRASRLRKADGNRLFGGRCSMFALPNMVHLFTNEFPGLRGS